MSDAPASGDDVSEALQSAYNLLRRRYEAPALVVIVAFMLWVRLQAMGRFISGDKVYFAGNDPYYHFREINYVVRHWPFTMPFDPWTYFPYGTSQGQFGTLFDQLIATAALVIGLGSPSEQLIAKTVIVAPAVFGTLVAIPTYFIGRRLAGRRAGVVAAVVLALLPGTFLQRGLVGFADHNIAEVLFQSTAVLAAMIAVSVAERDQPVYELVLDRDWTALRQPVAAGLVAGIALFLYIWLWPPGVVLVGILGIFLVIAFPLHVYRGRSPEPLAIVGVVSMSSLTVLQLLVIDTFGIASTRVSLLQVLLSAGVGFGCLYMAWLARQWDFRNLNQQYYPLVVGGSVLIGLGTIAVVVPSLYGTLVENFSRIFLFGQSATTLTVREAQSIPFDAAGEFLYRQYGFLFLTGLVGLAGLSVPVVLSRVYRPENLLVIVWGVAMTLMALTQIRFNYYLAVVVAVSTAWAVEQFLELIDLPSSPQDIEVYQVLSLLVAVLLVVAPLVPPLATSHVVAVGDANGPGAVVTWTDELDWMENNTPAEGRYGGASNDLEYYGTYEQTDDFAYPEGTYGVMSWWDYGHWITVEGERIPNANPFQQGPRVASAFLLAENETRANLILEAIPSRPTSQPIYDMSVAELRQTVAAQSSQQASEDTRYVMIDDQMAAGKFSAIATWTGPGSGIYFSRQEFQVGNSQAQLVGVNDRYHGTMLARLYLQDANGLSHYRLVHETGDSAIVSVAQRTPQGFQSTNFINRRLTQQVLTAVEQRPDLYFYDIRQEATVKTFERVPGATLTGQVNTSNATTVLATVSLQTNAGRNFTYIQSAQTDADGNFEMTVPYATTNSVGPAEGGTDSGVVARGNYQLFVGNPFAPTARGNTSVPEPAIYDGDTITVELQPVEQSTGNETNSSNGSSLGLPIDSPPSASLSPAGDPTGASSPSPVVAAPRRAADV